MDGNTFLKLTFQKLEPKDLMQLISGLGDSVSDEVNWEQRIANILSNNELVALELDQSSTFCCCWIRNETASLEKQKYNPIILQLSFSITKCGMQIFYAKLQWCYHENWRRVSLTTLYQRKLAIDKDHY